MAHAQGGFTVDISGLNPLIRKLEEFPDRLKPELKTALRAGANIIRAAAQANVNIGPRKSKPTHNPGALRKSIKTKVGRQRGGYTSMLVTTAGGDSLFRGDTYYGGFVEYGHAIGSRKKARTGAVAPHPFIGKAVDQVGAQAVAAIERALQDAITRLGGTP